MHTPHSPRLLWMVPGISAMLASVCLAADTDSDGLDDAVETNTGVFVSASNTGTNPNAADTDGDGVPDGLEVRERTNPVDATKFNGFSKGLVAYLPLDVTISEQSGSQLRCTNHGTTAVPDRFGVQNNARDFDGLGNNIEITGSAPLQIPR